MKTSNCPPPLMGIDVSVPPPSANNHYENFHHYPPPINYSSPPPVTSHFTGHSTPVTKIKEENHSNSQGRSPSPYSPSRPCEDEDELNHVVANPLPVLQPPPLPPSSLNNKGAAGPTFIVKGEWSTRSPLRLPLAPAEVLLFRQKQFMTSESLSQYSWVS